MAATKTAQKSAPPAPAAKKAPPPPPAKSAPAAKAPPAPPAKAAPPAPAAKTAPPAPPAKGAPPAPPKAAPKAAPAPAPVSDPEGGGNQIAQLQEELAIASSVYIALNKRVTLLEIRMNGLDPKFWKESEDGMLEIDLDGADARHIKVWAHQFGFKVSDDTEAMRKAMKAERAKPNFEGFVLKRDGLPEGTEESAETEESEEAGESAEITPEDVDGMNVEQLVETAKAWGLFAAGDEKKPKTLRAKLKTALEEQAAQQEGGEAPEEGTAFLLAVSEEIQVPVVFVSVDTESEEPHYNVQIVEEEWLAWARTPQDDGEALLGEDEDTLCVPVEALTAAE